MDKILLSLFDLVENVIQTKIKLFTGEIQATEEKKEDEGTADEINTFKTGEVKVAISMLNVFIE